MRRRYLMNQSGPEAPASGCRPRKAANSSPTGGRCAIRVVSAGGTPAASQARVQVRREGSSQAKDHEAEEDADGQHHGRVLEGRRHSAPDSALVGRQAVHDLGPVRRREQAHRGAQCSSKRRTTCRRSRPAAPRGPGSSPPTAPCRQTRTASARTGQTGNPRPARTPGIPTVNGTM